MATARRLRGSLTKAKLVEPESLMLDLRGHVRDLLLSIILRGPW
jgi:hypothetical protein